MLEIIPTTSFTTTFWKNGKGQTTELAINEGGNLDKFDWRLSIATVAEDGPFSNFKGYERNLVLIEGNGLTLTHDVITTDRLTEALDFATFDGGSNTHGEILNGTIKDFNIMTAKDKYKTKVNTYKGTSKLTVNNVELAFIYSLSGDIDITSGHGENQTINQGDLAKLTSEKTITFSGKDLIVIKISYIKNS